MREGEKLGESISALVEVKSERHGRDTMKGGVERRSWGKDVVAGMGTIPKRTPQEVSMERMKGVKVRDAKSIMNRGA